MRILLVDDEPALRELLRATLESVEITVDEAASALEAETVVRRRKPDLIVLDLRMPGMSGAEFCAGLKEKPRTRDIPVVVLTAADPEDARAAERAGAAAVVHKPFSPLELLSVIEGLVGRTPVPLPSRRKRRAGDEEEIVLYARDLRHLLEVERAQRRLLEDSYLETVTALATALESKDGATRAHSQRVQRYATELLEAMAPGSSHAYEYGFLLHDIGKIGIPDAILLKPGPLTRSERKRMQTHTVIGEQMLSGVAVLRSEGLQIVRSHHERWDGRGYPDGIAGDDVPLGARVFAVADALDAMTSNRPYRRAIPWRAAHAEILTQAGKQFDPDVVDAFREREASLAEVRRELAAA
jgi:response regulator RpfG family c-di-GMP phosphodiesterase